MMATTANVMSELPPGLLLVGLVAFMTLAGFALARRRVLLLAGGDRRRLRSLPHEYALAAALWIALPAALLWAVFHAVSVAQPWAQIAILAAALAGFAPALRQADPAHHARRTVERALLALLMLAASVAILTTRDCAVDAV